MQNRIVVLSLIIKEWSNLSLEVRLSVSHEVFKISLMKFIRPTPCSLFDVSTSPGIWLPTRLRLGLSHLTEHNVKHKFQDSINPLLQFRGRINFTFFSCSAKTLLAFVNVSRSCRSELFCKKRCTQKFRKIDRKIPVPESLF